jgi:hypothetical protein
MIHRGWAQRPEQQGEEEVLSPLIRSGWNGSQRTKELDRLPQLAVVVCPLANSSKRERKASCDLACFWSAPSFKATPSLLGPCDYPREASGWNLSGYEF